MCLCVDFFGFILFAELESVGLCLLPDLENFQPSFLCIHFQPPLPLFSFQDADINIRSLLVIPQVPEALFLVFQYIFILICSGCHNKKNAIDWVVQTTEIYSSQLWRLEVQDQSVGFDLWCWISSQCPFLLCPHMAFP